MANILFIEDDPLVRQTVFDILSLEGHDVTLAEDGEQGLPLFEQGEYDMVFTDLGLPGMSGWQVVEALNKRQPNVPVIVITGWPENIIRQALSDNEVQHVLSKPFTIEKLLGLVTRLMGRCG